LTGLHPILVSERLLKSTPEPGGSFDNFEISCRARTYTRAAKKDAAVGLGFGIDRTTRSDRCANPLGSE